MASVRLPRLLEGASIAGLRQEVPPGLLSDSLAGLVERNPALGPHLLDETGALRPHVLFFVDGVRANLNTPVRESSELIVLQAVSGGSV